MLLCNRDIELKKVEKMCVAADVSRRELQLTRSNLIAKQPKSTDAIRRKEPVICHERVPESHWRMQATAKVPNPKSAGDVDQPVTSCGRRPRDWRCVRHQQPGIKATWKSSLWETPAPEAFRSSLLRHPHTWFLQQGPTAVSGTWQAVHCPQDQLVAKCRQNTWLQCPLQLKISWATTH